MDQLVDVTSVAKLCKASPRTVKNWAAKGKLPGAYKLGGMWKFDMNKIKRWIFEKEVKPCLYINEVKHTGYDLPSKVPSTAVQLRQALNMKL